MTFDSLNGIKNKNKKNSKVASEIQDESEYTRRVFRGALFDKIDNSIETTEKYGLWKVERKKFSVAWVNITYDRCCTNVGVHLLYAHNY